MKRDRGVPGGSGSLAPSCPQHFLLPPSKHHRREEGQGGGRAPGVAARRSWRGSLWARAFRGGSSRAAPSGASEPPRPPAVSSAARAPGGVGRSWPGGDKSARFIVHQHVKETKAGRSRQASLALPFVPSKEPRGGERALRLLVFETRPRSRGRKDNAEAASPRNWTTKQALPAPPLPGRSSSEPRCSPAGSHRVSPPLGGESAEKTGVPGRPSTPPIGRLRGGPGCWPPPALPPRPPRPAADWHSRGWGSSTARGPRFAKSRASAACWGTFARGHALSAEAAPRDPLLRRSPSLATLTHCSRPSSHSQLWRLALSAPLPPAAPHTGEGTARRGTPQLPAAPAEQTPGLPRPDPRPCAHPFYSPGRRRRGAQSLSGGMRLLIT